MIIDLPRGFEIKPDLRIRKTICAGDDWRIISLNNRGYVLAATQKLLRSWEEFIDTSFFRVIPEYDLYICTCDSGFIISSLSQGPYPDNANRVFAFSTVLGKFREKYPGKYFNDAIYIEQHGLLLPVDACDDCESIANAYGRWLTGGVTIPGNDLEKLRSFVSWMPAETLVKSVCTAHMIEKTEIETKKAKQDQTTPGPMTDSIPDEAFHLIGRPDLETFFNESIIDIIRHEEEYKRMGIGFPGATILYGLPGSGKTFAVDRLAEYLHWPRFDIEAGSVASPYIHETSRKISEVFSQAIAAAPSILVIDEMESYLSDRANAGSTGIHHIEEVGEFLRGIPEAIENHVLIFAMTNMIDKIDPAILRRGRFDHVIEVKMASVAEIEALLKEKFDDLPVDEDADIHAIAEELENHPLSDVTYVLKEAGREAVKAHKQKMDKACFDKAIASLPESEKKKTRKIGF